MLVTEFRATPANRGNVGVAELVARFRARFANLGARAAGDSVQVRVTKHEILRRVGDRHAIKQVADVMRIGVLAALFQAVVNGVQAGVMRVCAGVNALVMFVVLVFVDVRHGLVRGL